MKPALCTILLACSSALPAAEEPEDKSEQPALRIDGLDTATTIENVKSALPFASDWKTFEWKGNKLLVGLSDLPTSGESYIDVHGYLYNRSFREWRRFCLVKTRNVGWAEIGLDPEKEELYLLAKANTPMKGKRVFRYSLLLLSDDRSYLPEDRREGADQPANTQEPEPERKPGQGAERGSP